MAGSGFKSFTAGSVLGAGDVNTYLMQQTVMVFATTSARSTAITSPTDGMVTYITLTKTIELYDGGGWTVIGGGNSSTYPNQPVVTSGGYSRPVPFAMSAGSASITTSGTVTIGSTGRFTQNPLVIVSLASTSTNRTSVTWSSTGTPLTAINAYVWTGAVAATVTATVHFIAIQMTSAASANT